MHATANSSIPNIFINDYLNVLRDEYTYDVFIEKCCDGALRTSSMRSTVWRIVLKCLPESKNEWIEILTRTRHYYQRLKSSHITDPRAQTFSQDPQLNNPLLPSDENPWHKFFEDGDLRDIISKDVERTFPEIEFFQQSHVRKIMADILLVYAKEHPFVSYKQGMHEILAPLIFVIYSDQQAYSHALETEHFSLLTDNDRKVLQCLNDQQYLEHDAYTLFREVMLEVAVWYEDGTDPHNMSHEPFSRVQDGDACNGLLQELKAIGEELVALAPDLASHLSSLDIPPQLYGIRWLRLLFGREFAMHDLLYLWDVLLCDRPIARPVQAVFLAMLLNIQPLLLSSDYGGCLQYLMRYPPVVDMTSFMQLVLHLRSPKKFARPKSCVPSNYAHLTVQGKNHPNSASVGLRGGPIRARPVEPILSFMSTPRRPPQPHSNVFEQQTHLLEEQVAMLQNRLMEREAAAAVACSEMECCAFAMAEGKVEGLVERLRSASIRLREAAADVAATPFSLPSRGRVEQAQEVVPRTQSAPRRLRRDNEMMEIRSSDHRQRM